MPLDPAMQKTLIGRLEKLSEEELLAFDAGINQQAALILLYKIIPEIDFVLLQGLTALEGHQYQPELVLNGEGAQQQGMPPQGGPQGMQPQPQPRPQPAPQPQPRGALGGLNAGPPR